MDDLDLTTLADYRAVLRAWIAAVPWRSQSALARRVGASRSQVSMILRGQRRLDPALAGPWARALDFADADRLTFEAMVRMEEGGSLAVRRTARQHVEALRDLARARQIRDDHLHLLERWYVPVILELARVGRLRLDAAWLAGRLWPEVEADELAPVLDELVALGVLNVDDQGTVTADYEALRTVRTPLDQAGEIARRYHRQHLAHAQDSLYDLAPDERYLASVVVTVPASKVAALFEAVHRFPLDVTGPFRDLPGADTPVQVSVQAFPRVREPGTGEGG